MVAFPQTHADGEQWNGAAVTDLETRAASFVQAQAKFLVFTRPGSLVVETPAARLPFPKAAQLSVVIASVATAPTGASIIVDVLKNGTTIWGTNPGSRPTIAAAGNVSAVATPDTLTMAAGDYLQVKIVQVGSIVAGSDLTVSISYS